MLIQATQLRPGMIVEYNKDLWRIMTITHITPGNWRGMVQTKLRNIKTGSQTENRFRSEDRVERVILNQSKMQFLYQDGDDFHFMNTENYEQITIPKELIEDVVGFLTPNLEVEVEFYETTPLNVTLPKTVALKVVQTDPGMKTAAVNNTLKPATLETGMVINVPHFVAEGDTITINTETKSTCHARSSTVRTVNSARQTYRLLRAMRKAALPERAQPHPIRFGPNLYIAHTQPGFEGIAADEIAGRIRGRARDHAAGGARSRRHDNFLRAGRGKARRRCARLRTCSGWPAIAQVSGLRTRSWTGFAARRARRRWSSLRWQRASKSRRGRAPAAGSSSA